MICVFPTGLPIGTDARPSPALHSWNVTSTAASVGPYRLCSSAHGSFFRHRSFTSTGSASPLHTTLLIDLHSSSPGSSRNAWSIDGTKCSVVTPSSLMTRRRYAGS